MAAIAGGGNTPIGGHAPRALFCDTEAIEMPDISKLSITEEGDDCGTTGPNLENHFLLQLNEVRFLPHESHGVLDWINPYFGCVIQPYIPSENDRDLVDACALAFKKIHPASLQEATLCKKEIAIVVLAHSNPKALIAFSNVSKSLYWLTKNSYNPEIKQDAIWDTKLYQLFPNVERVPLEKTIFSPEQQYKIVFRRFRDELKPYVAKCERLREKSLRLKEEMHQIWTQLVDGEELLERAEKRISTKRAAENDATPQATVSTLTSPEILALRKLQDEYAEKKGTVAKLSGTKFNGSYDSILRTSELGQLLNAIDVLIPEVFNNQAKFEEVIQQAETSKNNTSSNDNGALEEVNDPMNLDDK